jgi:hypothetical protein
MMTCCIVFSCAGAEEIILRISSFGNPCTNNPLIHLSTSPIFQKPYLHCPSVSQRIV